jgi:hypothetical protein
MKVDISENEAKFQEALNKWIETKDTKQSEIMFECIYAAATNIALSIYKKRGFEVAGTDTVYNKAIDATLICMRNILQRGHKPSKLSSYCYTRVLSQINSGPSSFDRINDKIERLTPASNIIINNLSEEETWVEQLTNPETNEA